METAQAARAVLLVLPLFLLGLLIIPGRWRWPLAAGFGLLGAACLSAFMPIGILSYLSSFSTMAMIYAILALGLNSQWGLSGQVNFGIAGFFAIGAFSSALLTTDMPAGALAAYSQQVFGLGWPYIAGVIGAGLISALVGFLVSVPVLRLRADFLAIATLGIAEIIRLILQNERWLANGPQPLRGIPQPGLCLFKAPRCSWLPEWIAPWLAPLGPRDYTFFYLLLTALVLAVLYWAIERISRAPWGRVQRAIRDDERAAAMYGKPVTRYRVEAFVIGSFIMGIGGAVYAHHMIAIDYSHFNPLFATFLVWVMLMLGGSGNNKGAILGAFAIWGVWVGTETLVGQLSSQLQSIMPGLVSRSVYLRWMLVAIMLAAIVLYRPQGIIRERKRVSDFMARDRD